MEAAPSTETVDADKQLKVAQAMRGQPKSGRFWKEPRKSRHTAIYKCKALKSSFERKMEEKNKLNQAQLLSRQIRDRMKQERKDVKERAKEQEERRQENERKAEVVQVIKNMAKLKKHKKKHLRTIQKRDTTNM